MLQTQPDADLVSMVFPMVQLVVLGYAFGGAVKNLKLGIVDQDGHLAAVRLRELFGLSLPTPVRLKR